MTTDIEQSIELLSRVPHSGLVVLTADVTTTAHRDLLIALAARFQITGGLLVALSGLGRWSPFLQHGPRRSVSASSIVC